MKILIIAPHPDDEVLGCGGTIARHSKNGDDVHLYIITEAYTPDWTEEFIENRNKEIKEACKILGIKKTHLLALPTVKLDTLPQKELNEKISKIITEVKPDILYIPFGGDVNKDHRLVFEACLVAARPVGSRIKRILCYETLSETEWGKEIRPFIPNVYVDISETFEKKLEAMKAYGSELKSYPHPRSLEIIKASAKKRGSEAHMKFAEAFMLIREIEV